jgi:hypothetical protein
MIIEHHRSAWRFAQRRLRGPQALLLPFAAAYFAVRAALAMLAHAASTGTRGRDHSRHDRG